MNIPLWVFSIWFIVPGNKQLWLAAAAFKSARAKRCGIYPCSSTWKFPAFLGVRDLIYITYCILSLFGYHFCIAMLYPLYLFLSLRILGGGSLLKFPGCVFVRKGLFYVVAFCVVSSLTKLRTFTYSVYRILNSLHPTLHPPCELHGKEQVHNGGEEVQGVYPIILFSFNIH